MSRTLKLRIPTADKFGLVLILVLIFSLSLNVYLLATKDESTPRFSNATLARALAESTRECEEFSREFDLVHVATYRINSSVYKVRYTGLRRPINESSFENAPYLEIYVDVARMKILNVTRVDLKRI